MATGGESTSSDGGIALRKNQSRSRAPLHTRRTDAAATSAGENGGGESSERHAGEPRRASGRAQLYQATWRDIYAMFPSRCPGQTTMNRSSTSVGKRARQVWSHVALSMWLVLAGCSPDSTQRSGDGIASDTGAAPPADALVGSPTEVLAVLGGVNVRVPRHFADNAEFDGDPGWSASGADVQQRTASSTLKSFGFKVRFPDMAGQSSPALVEERRSQSVYRTMWIGVGINSGANFPGSGFLDRRFGYINEAGRQFRYEVLATTEHGLTMFAPSGVDAATGQPLRKHRDAQDIFAHRGENGRIDAFITCSNRPHEAAPCRHDFSMEPEMKVQVYVTYRRGLLADWHDIQESVRRVILGFAVKPPSSISTSKH